jgi:hypothetical protein
MDSVSYWDPLTLEESYNVANWMRALLRKADLRGRKMEVVDIDIGGEIGEMGGEVVLVSVAADLNYSL